MNEWIEELSDLAAAGEPAVLVTVAGIRGSAPRELGAKMIVTARETIGTIGGGQLEYQSTRIAVEHLNDERPSLRSFPLGSSMGQCCGGVVEIMFEPVANGMPQWLQNVRSLHGQREPAVIATRISQSQPEKIVVTADQTWAGDERSVMVPVARRVLREKSPATRNMQEFYEPVVDPSLNIAVFGAGHVGSAVVNMLSTLDCNIRWIDGRRNMLRDVPVNVRAVEASDPSLEVAAMAPDSYFLVMTHSHALDFEICDRVLRRRDARYCGLIGSASKRRRFEKRFREQGLPQALIDKLVCPIGVHGISGKKPAEIAVAVCAEILAIHERGTLPAAIPDNVQQIRG